MRRHSEKNAGPIISGIVVGLMIVACLIFSEDEIRNSVADFIGRLLN